MDLVSMQEVGTVLVAILGFIVKYGPSIIVEAEEVVADLKMAWKSATSPKTLSDDDRLQIRSALNRANEFMDKAQAIAKAQDDADAAAAAPAAEKPAAEGQPA